MRDLIQRSHELVNGRTLWTPAAILSKITTWFDASDASTITTSSSTFGLTALTSYAAGNSPLVSTISKDGRFVYTSNNGGVSISIFSRNLYSGELTFQATVASSSSPYGIEITPDGRFLYIVNSSAATVTMYSRNTITGALTSLGTIATGSTPRYIAVSSDGLNAYVTNETGSSISAYSIDQSTGLLSSIGVTTGLSSVFHLAISQDGNSVYAVNLTTSQFVLSRNPSTGVLTLVNTITVGANTLRAVAISSDGISVYMMSTAVILIYSRNTVDGSLTFQSSISIGSGNRFIAVSPDNLSVYVVNNSNNTISDYSRNTSTGAITLQGSYTTEAGPSHIIFPPNGSSIYLTNFTAFTTQHWNRIRTVAQWRDKSLNAHHFSQAVVSNQPFYNGTSVNFQNVRAVRQFMENTSFTYSGNQMQMFSANTNTWGVGGPNQYGRIFSYASSTAQDYSNTAGIIMNYGFGGITIYRNSSIIAQTASVNSTWLVVEGNRVAGTGRISLNGSAYVNGTTSTANQNIQRSRIGNDFNAIDSGFFGFIAENIMTTQTLTQDEIDRVVGYLAWKWGTQATLAATHPYKNSPPTIG